MEPAMNCCTALLGCNPSDVLALLSVLTWDLVKSAYCTGAVAAASIPVTARSMTAEEQVWIYHFGALYTCLCLFACTSSWMLAHQLFI